MKKNNDKQVIKIVAGVIILLVILAILLLMRGPSRDTVPVPDGSYSADSAKPADIHNDYTMPAEIEPAELPEDLEGTVGFSPHQLDRLTEHYVLAKYDIGQDSVVYYYQAAETTSGERFLVICTKMSEEDYLNSIPTKNVTTETYNGVELTYSERWLYSVTNDFEMIEPIQKGIDEGTMEIEYGNTQQEVIKKNCFYWYDGGIKYEIQVRNQDLPYDVLFDTAKRIIDAK